MGKNILVRCGVVILGIDAVEDARQLPRALAQDRVEPVGIPRIQDLVGIRGADGGDAVGALDRALHKVDVTVVLDDARILGVKPQDLGDELFAVHALVLDIVNGENRLDVLIARRLRIHGAVIHRRERGLPIVAVDDVGLEFDMRQHFKHGAREERKALRIVIIAVDAVALEIVLVVEQIVDDAVRFGLKNAAVLPPPGNRHGDARQKRHFILELLLDAVVHGHDHAAADQPLTQRLGQRACHVGKPARRHERQRLARNIQNFHTVSPFHGQFFNPPNPQTVSQMTIPLPTNTG